MSARTTLTLQDRLSGPLVKIIRAMDNTIKVMEQMDSATQNLDKRSLSNARKSLDGAASDLNSFSSALSDAGDKANEAAAQQTKMSDAVNELGNTTGVDSLNNSLNEVTQSASKAAEQNSKLSDSAAEAAAQNSKLSDAVDKLGSTSGVESLDKSLGGVTESAAKATEQNNKLGEAAEKMGSNSGPEKLQSRVERLHGATEKGTQQQEEFNEKVSSGTTKMLGYGSAILSAVGAYKLFNAATDFLKDSFSRGIDFHAFRQASEVAFTTFLGDAEKAQQYMDDMYAFALKTPFAYPDLLESSRNLIAFGIAADNTFPIMQSIGDAVAAVGGGNAEMRNMADIFGQIQSQGRITRMELNRLSQYGVNGIQMLAEAAGVSGEEMRKQISAGAVDAGTAISVLVAGMDKQFGGLMEGVKGTWRGAIDSLNSARRNAGAAMTQDLMEPLTDSIGMITNLLNQIPRYIGPAVAAFIPLIEMINSTFGNNRFDSIFAAMGASITVVANILSWMGQVALWALGLFADNWAIIEPILLVMGTVLASITAILLTKYAVLGAIRLATLAWAAAQWVVNAAYLSNPIVWVLLIIIAVIALVIYAMLKWSEQTSLAIGFIVGGLYMLGAIFQNILIGIANLGIIVAEWFANSWNDSIFYVQMMWIGLNILVRQVLDAIANGALVTAEFFTNAFNDAVYGVEMLFYGMQRFFLGVARAIAGGVEGIVNAVLGGVSTAINAATGGLNKLIGLANKIPGVSISTIGSVDLSVGTGLSSAIKGLSDNLAAPQRAARADFGRVNTAGAYMDGVTAPQRAARADFGRIDYVSTGEAALKGFGKGVDLSTKATDGLAGAVDKITGLLSGPGNDLYNVGEIPSTEYDPLLGAGAVPGGGAGGKAPGGPGSSKGPKGANNPTGGKLDSIGGIDDDINIAEEDLKLLRELAERDSIRDIRTTLSPHIQFGDMTIREEADIDKLIKKLEKMLAEELDRSAEGSYS